MATLLYRIGHFAYRRAWLVIGVWIVVLGGILGGGFALGGHTQESFAIPGTESQDAIDKLAAVFPAASGASAQVVYQAPAGATVDDPAYKAAIEKMATELTDVTGVSSVLSPYSPYAGHAIAKGGRTAYTTVQFAAQSDNVTPATLNAVTATAAEARKAGLTVAFGGQVFQNTTFGVTLTEGLGVLFAGVVLVITFGSLLAAGMPLLTALLGVGITMGAVTALSAFTTVSSASPMLALMLGLAVGIDYALFILSRHRTQLARGMAPEESAATAVATAGSAVVFAGATVIIALLGLLVVGIPFLSVMGLAAAFAVLVAIAVATTLVPAMLGLAKGRLIPKDGSRAWRRAHAGISTKPTVGLRWVTTVMKAPVAWVVVVVIVLGTLAIPALSLDLNLPGGDSQPKGSTGRQAYDLIASGFGPGYNGPLIIAVDITQTNNVLGDLTSIRSDLGKIPDVAYVNQGIPNSTFDTAIISVIPKSAPDSPVTKQLVQAIRDDAPSIAKSYHTPITVTGQTAVAVDISNRLSGALIPFALVVVGLSIILLTMVFRSIFVPIKAAVGFLLSISASIGVVVAIFQWGWLANLLGIDVPGPILSFLPIIMMALLFGLAMDYEVFLVSGMREEFVRTGDAKSAVRTGFSHASRVVTAAALIMFFVFFAFVPEGSGVIKGIALGLAVGIVFDAFLVRMTFGPAAMALAGAAAWWLPRWLARILPNVDIEGDGLRRHLEDHAWARTQDAAISADSALVGVEGSAIGPITLSVPGGAMLFMAGDAADRRVVAATLAGRLDPVAGRIQVLGAALPSERARAMRQVTLADVGALESLDSDRTVSEVLAERIELTGPWWRTGASSRQLESWVERVNAAFLSAGVPSEPIAPGASLAALGSLQRAVIVAAAALTERSGVIVIDLGDGLPGARDDADFAAVVAALAPASTSVVLGSSLFDAARAQAPSGRQTFDLDLYTFDRKGVLL
ncbi:MAG: putative drug exporter of the superfamily [Microbacteriaceae bacterium]|nr:putative drug exporter of the superfamily [Microbacteriaceae bacterium]